MKIVIRCLIFGVAILALILCYISFKESQWETLTASLSAIIALSSSWIAFEVFQIQKDSNKPQIIIEFDMKSRPRILQLVIANYGNKPAFNISIDWHSKLLQRNNKPFNFSTNELQEIPVLNKDEKLIYFIDSTVDFYKKHETLTYSGIIRYSLSKKRKFFKKEKFEISLVGYKETMLYETELGETLKEIRKIPKILEEIKSEINK